MAQIGNFDTNEVTATTGYEAIPPGVYIMKITDSDIKDTKANPKNKYLWLEHTIIDGPYKNRKIYNNLNKWNTNPAAVNMADAMLKQLCLACGKTTISDSVELHGIMFSARVGIDTKGDRGPQNRIDAYLSDAAPEAKGTVAAATPSAGGNSAPWSR